MFNQTARSDKTESTERIGFTNSSRHGHGIRGIAVDVDIATPVPLR